MIQINDRSLVLEFPGVHEQARLTISFQRTLRIPDDGQDYPLPPGLGGFPLRRVEELEGSVPAPWRKLGGAVLPMYQSEALWLSFESETIEGRGASYPFAVKIATGRLNAVSGESMRRGLHREPQDYVVVPDQPWLDGFCVGKGIIRQFVAMPLGAGYSGEEQLLKGEHEGGLRIAVFPMKRARFDRLFPELPARTMSSRSDICYSESMCYSAPQSAMGLGAGGRMRQEIYDDSYKLSDWSRPLAAACHVHLANSLIWSSLIGAPPPQPPPTARDYDRAGLPWFEWYSDKPALAGAGKLAKLKSIKALDAKKGAVSLPENESTPATVVVPLGPKAGAHQVSEVAP